MRQVFISYRRSDARLMCDRIHDALIGVYGSAIIFRDIENLTVGDFRQGLSRAISNSGVMLVIMGPHWLAVRDQLGRPRIFDPQDFVRLEVETALMQRVPIIPVLVEGAQMPPAHYFPPSLAQLAYQQARVVRSTDPDFQNDMQVVIADIARLVPLVSPVVSGLRATVNRVQRVASFVFGAAAALVTLNAILNGLNLGVNLPGLTDLIHHFFHR